MAENNNGTIELLHSAKVESLEHGNNETAGKRKLDGPGSRVRDDQGSKRRKGTAPIREEYLIHVGKNQDSIAPKPQQDVADDDAAEAFHRRDRAPAINGSKKRQKNQGQNTGRKFGKSRDEVGLCSSRVHAPEFSPLGCKYGEDCRFEHDLRRYLREHKREDLATFRVCPVWEVTGYCSAGWKCRFLGSHSKEVEHADGTKELVLVEDAMAKSQHQPSSSEEIGTGVVNSISPEARISLTKRKFPTPKSDVYLHSLENVPSNPEKSLNRGNSSSPETTNQDERHVLSREDNRSLYQEPAFLASEKRRLYFDASTPVLAPLTTQGNLPFRRLCTSLGAMFTYSEMAMSLPLLQGHKPEWALIKAHESELQPPTLTAKDTIVQNYPTYNPATDSRFSAQIAANKPWAATKATEVLSTLLPAHALRSIDLNVGCPIDLVYREGAGSALMDSPSKLEKMLHGMNAVSGTTPITCKIRLGTRDNKPTAQKLVERLVLGGGHDDTSTASLGAETQTGSCVAAITLHGRSRQQRYTRSADWEYIASTAALIRRLNSATDALTDTIHDPDPRNLPPGTGTGSGASGKVFFLGNGDCYSHTSYSAHIQHSGVDSVMIARGALQKPWIFEEIAAGQSLDKSSSERLAYVERFCRFGLEAWGSDEWGIGTTRRFLLEWLSFACRYVPVGLLERMPATEGEGEKWMEPSIQDRAPAYRGRDDLETLMASEDYRDWIKIRYVIIPSITSFFMKTLPSSGLCGHMMMKGWLTSDLVVRCFSVLRTRISDSNQSIRAMLMKYKLRAER